MTIVEFLTARLDEESRFWANPSAMRFGGVGLSELILRMRADIAAKRTILALHVPVDYTALGMDSPNACEICGADLRMGDWEWVKDSYPCQTVRLLASLYETHKDYDPSWRVG